MESLWISLSSLGNAKNSFEFHGNPLYAKSLQLLFNISNDAAQPSRVHYNKYQVLRLIGPPLVDHFEIFDLHFEFLVGISPPSELQWSTLGAKVEKRQKMIPGGGLYSNKCVASVGLPIVFASMCSGR